MVYDTGRTNPVPTSITRPAGEFGCIGERTSILDWVSLILPQINKGTLVSHVSPCFNCKQPTEKTVLKDQVWQCKSGGIVHRVMVPELIVNMCAACGEHSIGGDGDEQITEALRVHISQPCGC